MTANPWFVEGINSINKPDDYIEQKILDELSLLR